MFSWSTHINLLINANIILLNAFPVKDTSPQQFGLMYAKETRISRERYQLKHDERNSNSSMYTYNYHNEENAIYVVISISKKDLEFVDNYQIKPVICLVNYSSNVPLALSYDLDFTLSAELVNQSWYWLPPSLKGSTNISVYILPKLVGLDYLVFWIRQAKPMHGYISPTPWFANNSETLRKQYFDNLLIDHRLTVSLYNNQDDNNENNTLGFPVIVIADKGIGYLVFRIFVIVMVTIFTFTMGCDLEIPLILHHFKRPISISIGFFCQFFFMPLIAFGIVKIIPIRSDFGFGLLTIACSPGGGASNGWCLLLGGDINLSILMTFISSLSALFMMPLLLFIYGRFFIDVTKIKIPYLNIVFQLLQVAIPALMGLGLRIWKPKLAVKCTKLTRPLFYIFILFFLTIGVYINWSLTRLLAVYPLLILTSALLPWLGFCIASLFTLILRQSRQLIITVALETGIQNIGVGILVLLYTMPKPTGELGAIMPITVAMLTPIPLCLIYLGLVIKRKCCDHQNKKPVIHDPCEVEPLSTTKISSNCSNDVINPSTDNNQSPTQVSLTETTVTTRTAIPHEGM
ncbi:unnamed protein product [Schistosoma rodhaini]|uniref:Uncharacterized protein n=1 Tax=Schistosoma rodhaini TaxID=6188 RepID=A0AA85G6N5_9TREM|nr:unnamed protein product [Schistosoma rodhaini]